MELLLHSLKTDWFVLGPILICSILVLAVVIDRGFFYSRNKRDIQAFVPKFMDALKKNNTELATTMSENLGGIFGELFKESVRIYTEQRKSFSRSFDISESLAVRSLEKNLTILGTIGGVAPFLGLFGTVVRILYTFQDLATQGNQSAAVAMGIASALIATAVGLGVAIVAVIFYNLFQSIVRHYEDDFQLIKLVFLSFVDSSDESKTKSQTNIAL